MDFRIPRSSVDGLDEGDYFWALIEKVWPDDAANELQRLRSATPGQRALYVTTLCIREVGNGGLDQFFSNSSGMYAGHVRKAFRLLGAEEPAEAFEKALKIFPGGRAPVDEGERQSLLDEIPDERRKAFFKPLEEELFGEHRLWPYFQKYVDMHPSEFFVDDTSRRRRRSPSK
jgi:hypothetical protein